MGQRHFDALLQQAITIDRRAIPLARVMWVRSQRDPLGAFPTSFNQAVQLARQLLQVDEDYQQQLILLVRQRRVFCLDATAEQPRYSYNPTILESP